MKVYRILIPEDMQNKDKEQYKIYQLDGVTKQVPVGKLVEVPEWLAKRAKEIGDISDYFVSEA